MPPPTAALYVHVPFRLARRKYDDAAYGPLSPQARRRYQSAVQVEATDYVAPRLSDGPLQSIYVGGGRPSLLPLDALRQLFAALPATGSAREVTMEVAPADATPDYLDGLAELGVTRLSLAGLSFSPAVLRALDAPHTAGDVVRAIETARAAGFNTVAVDLLFGMDGLSSETWNSTLQRARTLDIPHLSIVEVSSAAPEDAVADQLERALSLLREAGYEHYSLTHFAQPGRRSAHQEHYDRHGAFFGLGPSATSLWWNDAPTASGIRARRWSNAEDLDTYAERLRRGESPAVHQEDLDAPALAREYILIRLRTRDGVSLPVLRRRYNLDLRNTAGALLDRLRTRGLIHDAPDRVRLTDRGRLLTDAITRRILSSL